MKKKLRIFLLVILSVGFFNCGFKVVKNNNFENISITDLNLNGDSRVNFLIKNKLKIFKKRNAANLIKLDIFTNKIKLIKDKNINNEVSNYEIIINAKIMINNLNTNTKKTFTVKTSADLKVESRNSTTRNNEKKLIDRLSNKIADEILSKISNNIE
jgi:outer membrane lipopolysaccharide assembly protein LptE/RlpB